MVKVKLDTKVWITQKADFFGAFFFSFCGVGEEKK